jgi:nucleoside-diphosphate-sugar epimerase
VVLYETLEYMTKKKVLITGGAGFLGSHLTDRLLGDGHKVIVIDDFSTGKMENLQADNRNLSIYNRSVLEDIGNLFEGVDAVFHLAALTRPQESIKEPKLYNYVNIEGTLNILNNCRNHKVKRLVFVSSSSLYGEQDKLPTPETATPNPMSPYALTKLIGEQYCKLFERLYGLEANYIRPFNVFGPRQNPEGGYAAAVPKFIDMLKKGETPYITGDGEQNRDFVAIEDVIDLMVLASESKVYGEAFNAGSGENITINELYKTICGIMGKKVKPNYVPAVLEPRTTLADMGKARRLLGWEPKVSLKEGLERILK